MFFPLAAQEENCISSSVVQKYQGTIAKTKTNTTCLNWNSTEIEKYITEYKLTFPGQYNFTHTLGPNFSYLCCRFFGKKIGWSAPLFVLAISSVGEILDPPLHITIVIIFHFNQAL